MAAKLGATSPAWTFPSPTSAQPEKSVEAVMKHLHTEVTNDPFKSHVDRLASQFRAREYQEVDSAVSRARNGIQCVQGRAVGLNGNKPFGIQLLSHLGLTQCRHDVETHFDLLADERRAPPECHYYLHDFRSIRLVLSMEDAASHLSPFPDLKHWIWSLLHVQRDNIQVFFNYRFLDSGEELRQNLPVTRWWQHFQRLAQLRQGSQVRTRALLEIWLQPPNKTVAIPFGDGSYVCLPYQLVSGECSPSQMVKANYESDIGRLPGVWIQRLSYYESAIFASSSLYCGASQYNLLASSAIASLENISAAATRRCDVCFEEQYMTVFPKPTASCQHQVRVCGECIRQTILVGLTDTNWNSIRCPSDGCTEGFQYDDVRKHLSNEDFDRYDRLSVRAMLSNCPDFHQCPNPRLCAGEAFVEASSRIFDCPECRLIHCLDCRSRVHFGEACRNPRCAGLQAEDASTIMTPVAVRDTDFDDHFTLDYTAARGSPNTSSFRIDQRDDSLDVLNDADFETLIAGLQTGLSVEEALQDVNPDLSRERRDATVERGPGGFYVERFLSQAQVPRSGMQVRRSSRFASFFGRLSSAPSTGSGSLSQRARYSNTPSLSSVQRLITHSNNVSSRVVGITTHEQQQQQESAEERERKLREKQELASEKEKQKISKPCPGCSVPIQKNLGCDHMSCPRCTHQYCWDCLSEYGKGHKISCKHRLAGGY